MKSLSHPLRVIKKTRWNFLVPGFVPCMKFKWIANENLNRPFTGSQMYQLLTYWMRYLERWFWNGGWKSFSQNKALLSAKDLTWLIYCISIFILEKADILCCYLMLYIYVYIIQPILITPKCKTIKSNLDWRYDFCLEIYEC